MFLLFSLIQIRFWHSQSYLIYIIFFVLLLGVKYFGLTSSVLKDGSILFYEFATFRINENRFDFIFSKYYHRTSIENINSIRYLFIPIVVLVAPILLVATQPDLGTSILIAAGGLQLPG